MRVAEVRINAGLRKSVLIDRSLAGKNSRNAVRIIRGTKLRIHSAGRSTGDTVPAFGPGPSHCVAYGDVDCVRYKHIATFANCYIEDLTATSRYAAHGWSTVLIYNMDPGGSGLFLLRRADVFFT